jgi:hypothetical protein
MTTLRDELHALIERLPDDELQIWVTHLREAVSEDVADQKGELATWLERARQFRAELRAKYGELPDSVDLLHEAREERLNDLMGRE